ncbi:MAG: stage V sporulation protein SpoVM [Ruminococcaceae bacterium]|nr:stage V sporulation protein SpoVM [Oscillospiraceae bacterium]
MSECVLFAKNSERRGFMKIVVVKAPRFLKGILKTIFKIKNDE